MTQRQSNPGKQFWITGVVEKVLRPLLQGDANMPSLKSSLIRKAPLNKHQQWNCTNTDPVQYGFLPDKTVNFRASWAIMLTKPFTRVSRALPSSIKYLDSQARQYCSLECSMLLQGAVKLPEKSCRHWIHVHKKHNSGWLLARQLQKKSQKRTCGALEHSVIIRNCI